MLEREKLILTILKFFNNLFLPHNCIYLYTVHSILAVLPYTQGKALAENERPSLSVQQKYYKFPMIVMDCRELIFYRGLITSSIRPMICGI